MCGVGVLLALSAMTAVHALAQDAFRSSALAVRVDVLVTDGRKPVTGLTAADFELRDSGVVQSIELLDASQVPLNVVLLLDASASTLGARHADLVAASHALIDGLRPADRVALTTFSHAVKPRVPLTSDFALVRSDLERVEPGGQTAVLDAVYVALATTLAQPGRSLVVVCSDVADISSWLRPDDVIETARQSNAVIYAVTAQAARDAAAIEDLTGLTGGARMRVESRADLRAAFRKILEEFRSRYILAYTPAGVPSGGFHALDVRVKRRGLSVRARPGYVGLERPR